MDNSYCCVPQCYSLGSQRPRTSFHRFPREKDEPSRRRRKEWIRLLRIGKTVSNRMVVCGKHFQPSDFFRRGDGPLARTKLRKNALPSLNLPVSCCENREVLNKKKDNLRRKEIRRKKMRESASGSINTVPEPEPDFLACCFVPGCISDCNKTREENKIVGKRNSSSFLLSKDDQLFGKWKRMIPPRKNKILSLKHKVYKLHFEEVCIETDSEFDTVQQSNDFLKLSNDVKNISTPNSWWSVACTEDCIIFSKWNSKCSSERCVVICKDLSIKTFLMNVEVSLSIERCTIENISQLLQKVDDFIICENADSGTSGCLGFVVDKKQEFCHTCYESNKIERDAERRNAQTLVGKKMKSVSQVKSIEKRNTYPRKRVSDLSSELVESKHQCSQTKEAFLEAISHLPTEQQTTIKSCHSFKTWFL